MPPNVKEVALALESLDLSSHVLSKYAPLTSELAAEEEQATAAAAASASAAHDDESSEQVVGLHHAAAPAKLQQQQQHYEHAQDVEKQQQQQREADSYWGMPHQPEPTEESRRQALIDDILREDEIRQMFTVDRIVANLVAEKGDERKEGVAQAAATAAADDADSYWDMPADEVEAEAAPIEAVDASIFSADHIVANLIASSHQQQQQQAKQEDEEIIIAPHVNDPSHPLHSYWDWDTSPQATSYEAKRLALVERIVQEEAARQLLSSDRIVANVVRSMAERSTAASTAATAATNTVTNTSSSKGSSDAYWSFAATTNTEDRIVAPHVNDPNHPLADYWTWDTSPKSDQEQRRVLVDWILREEAARLATCTDAVVDGLLKISSATNDANATCVVEESKESGEGYWDW